jgi:hypothetical protein
VKNGVKKRVGLILVTSGSSPVMCVSMILLLGLSMLAVSDVSVRKKKGESLRKAYLIGVIDTKAIPPMFRGAWIFSEEHPTVVGFPFTIMEAEGESYGEALEKLHRDIESNPMYHWTKRYIY